MRESPPSLPSPFEGEGMPPHAAPLDSCLRRNDEWGWLGGRDATLTLALSLRERGFLARHRRWLASG